jgi:predicted CxxxxCH...CXXCH cytochrome family protein
VAASRIGAAVIASLALGCTTARPVTDGARACVNWRDDIAPALAKQCGECHSGSKPQGGYAIDQYLAAITDTRAGDPDSRLLKVLDPTTADATHAALSSLRPLLEQWIVDCRVAYFDSPFHPGGILDPSDGDFHGALVRQSGWNLPLCAGCHGDDFAGGKAQASCLGCHQGGPTACTTCHAQPPASGAHLAHSIGAIAKSFDCGECHVKPLAYTDVGHLFDSDGKVIDRATVTFGALAGSGAKLDPPSGTCSGVYCHGSAQPSWNGSAPCGSCHGLPPSDHQSDRCSDCHQKVVDNNQSIIDKSRHVDGKVSLGDESGTCTACHPILDFAHTAHLTAPHNLTAKIACTTCHVVPAKLTDPGHLDGKVEVFPAALSATSLAFASGAKPAFDAMSSRCNDVYCHGGGALASDAAKSINRTPDWTAGSSQAECGACHGVPPVDASHDPTMTLGTCAKCHPATIDGNGNLSIATHMNGVVDVAK